ncbi:immunity 53 family protein [Hazenella sp. IB182353]|uniref:immunity 53 family protein n=1 Tax=Polycladospora coralii TaxID=2771432 RepID=UPI0017474806|nr:immunity 53 family protein [Polycladospora coralii]MBS7531389.1 immunity 53 family protein [Polycladospora coralii]
MNNLKSLERWYYSQCDEDWEHIYQIKLETVDNPGWSLEIDLEENNLENKKFSEIEIERSEDDWLFCLVRDNKFIGAGGPLNLDEILTIDLIKQI